MLFWGYNYQFVNRALKDLHRRYDCRLVTDFNVYETLQPYLIKYLFYPSINLMINRSEGDCLVVFIKQDMSESVPKGFKIISRHDHLGLVAVKEK